MGQQEIIEILEANPGKKYTSRELQEITGTSSIASPLLKLRKGDWINWDTTSTIRPGPPRYRYWGK